MRKVLGPVGRWFGRLSPVTSLNFVLFDLAVGFGLITWLLYISTPPSTSASAVLGSTLYRFIGPPTYGVILFVCCVYALVTAGLPDRYMQTGYYVLLVGLGLWDVALLGSCLYSDGTKDEINRILVTAIFIAMLISGSIRWLVVHQRNGNLR